MFTAVSALRKVKIPHTLRTHSFAATLVSEHVIMVSENHVVFRALRSVPYVDKSRIVCWAASTILRLETKSTVGSDWAR